MSFFSVLNVLTFTKTIYLPADNRNRDLHSEKNKWEKCSEDEIHKVSEDPNWDRIPASEMQ